MGATPTQIVTRSTYYARYAGRIIIIPPKPQEESVRVTALIPGMLPAAMAPPEVSLSATIPAVVEELFPDDFQTVETAGHRFSGLDEQTRSISY